MRKVVGSNPHQPLRGRLRVGRSPLAITALDALENAVGESLWTYPVIVAAVGIDSVLPLAPGEAVVITAGCWQPMAS